MTLDPVGMRVLRPRRISRMRWRLERGSDSRGMPMRRDPAEPVLLQWPSRLVKPWVPKISSVAGSESDCPRGDDALSVTDNHGDDEVTGDIELAKVPPVPTCALVDMGRDQR